MKIPDSFTSSKFHWRKKLAYSLGNVLTLACLYYVISRLFDSETEFATIVSNTRLLYAFILSVMLWILYNCIIGFAWRLTLKSVAGKVSIRESLHITLKTQAAKYLPGNVFHFAGRVMLAKRFNVPISKSILATILEIGLLAYLGSTIAIAYFWPFGYLILPITLAGLLAAPSMIQFGSRHLPFLSRFKEYELSNLPLYLASFFYLLIFIIQFLMLYLLSVSHSDELKISLINLFDTTTISWLVGFLVPGSPGGIGVREAVFSQLIMDESQQPTLLLGISLLRLASVIGDVLSIPLAIVLNLSKQNK